MLKNAKVMVAKCCKCQQYVGIRIEEKENVWHVNWAFKLTQKEGQREGYETGAVNGNFKVDESFPGCPHCHAKGIAQCGTCDHIVCYDKEDPKITCAFCGTTAERVEKVQSLNVNTEAF